jgi:hypothetical protein
MVDIRSNRLMCAYAIGAGASYFVPALGAVGTILVLPLIFFCPGAALIFGLEKPEAPVIGSRRMVLAIATSMALVALGGLLLNLLWALTGVAWVAWLVGATLGFSAIGFVRRLRDRDAPGAGGVDRLRGLRPSWPVAASLIALTVCCAGAAVLTRVTATQAFDAPIVRLYADPAVTDGHGVFTVENLTKATRRFVVYVEGTSGRAQRTDFQLAAGGSGTVVEPARWGPFVAAVFNPNDDRPLEEVVWDVARVSRPGHHTDAATRSEEVALEAAVRARGGVGP